MSENQRVTPIVPEWRNPDVNESFIRACDVFVLHSLLTDRTMTVYDHVQSTNILSNKIRLRNICDDETMVEM